MNLDMTIDSIIYRAAGEWTSSGFSGEWADAWSENTIQITVNDDNSVKASAPQFGEAVGKMEEGVMHMQFPNADEVLTARLRSFDDGKDGLEWSNGAVWRRVKEIDACTAPGEKECPELKGLNDYTNLLITEEGWGISSANWIVRRSPWTIKFLDEALEMAHVNMPLFGDQDAIINLVMNDQTLRTLAEELEDPDAILAREKGLDDPLDRHVSVIPQRELNAYDHLNAYTMDVDGYQFGDLLVTFPQCKDSSCNTLFYLAAEYAHHRDEFEYNPYDWAHVRLFGPRDHLAVWWKRHLDAEKDEEDEDEEQPPEVDPAVKNVRPEGEEGEVTLEDVGAAEEEEDEYTPDEYYTYEDEEDEE